MQDRPRALGMAQPRPRRRRRVRDSSAERLDAVGLVPPQLDRPRARRRPPDLGAQHLGRLPAPGRQRQDPLAPRRLRRAPSRWARARRRPGSTTGACSPDGELTFFDDGSNPPIHRQSRARADRARPQDATRRAWLAAYTHPDPPLLAASQGNMQTLAEREHRRRLRRACPQISEYARDGSLLFDAHLPFDMSFYRAFRFPWSGRPLSPPAVAASLNNTGEETIVHAELERRHRRRRLARARRDAARRRCSRRPRSRDRLRELDDPARRSYDATSAVQALDAAGHVLGDLAHGRR